ncbi:MAG TPA: TraB/GumN family protein [Chthoniobacterales bacterium]|nr:TraB/GumN family protein [Chthoniobacterales bacterium]
MFAKIRSHPVPWLLALAFCFIGFRAEGATGCVWKVTGPTGGTLFLGGSVHALRSTDYPLPPAYNRAFDASSRIVLEVEPKALSGAGSVMLKAGSYPKGDSLKNHVDPRTYEYLRRVFGLLKIPEDKFSRYRPWLLVLMLESPSSRGLSGDLGVDEFLTRRARANGKATLGLESISEHIAVFSGLTDRQSEALLLLTFIPQVNARGNDYIMSAWRRGDIEVLARSTRDAYREFPAFGERILGARNRRWAPKLEGYLKSGQTYFVVVGAAHLGGADGLLALLRARGCKVEPV